MVCNTSLDKVHRCSCTASCVLIERSVDKPAGCRFFGCRCWLVLLLHSTPGWHDLFMTTLFVQHVADPDVGCSALLSCASALALSRIAWFALAALLLASLAVHVRIRSLLSLCYAIRARLVFDCRALCTSLFLGT